MGEPSTHIGPAPSLVYVVKGDGQKTGAIDFSGANRAEVQLQAKFSLFQGFIDHSPSAISLKDSEGRYLFVNRMFEQWFARPASELVGKVVSDLVPEAAAERSAERDREALAHNGIAKAEYTVTLPDGIERRIVSTRFPVRLGDGASMGVGCVMADVTDFRRTQEQLRHAQKMEAVGELASGIAHDFNNLLVVILGNLELLLERCSDEAAVRGRAGDALRAAERGAALARRLLSFSRRQPLDPVVTDLNRLVPEVVALARHTLPANIEIASEFSEDAWPTCIDRSELENALLNLAVNARDAMPAGGRLTFGIENLAADGPCTWLEPEFGLGSYVTISVSDTGSGMPPELVTRAAEPFFTTKTEGTGLGLSMVQNFAKRSGGHMRIHSEAGRGTTVRLYLPRVADGLREIPEPETVRAKSGRRETILVVEDDGGLRRYLVHVLKGLGYSVIDAEDGPSALRALEIGEPIDLLFADVVLPGGMHGQDIARRASEIHSGIKLLFTSAYNREAIRLGGPIERSIEVLVKPVSRDGLARKVRDVLDRPSPRSAA